MNSSPLVRGVALTKSYQFESKTVEALRGVSVDIFPGEMVGIVGSSGAGKSTLMHILGALDHPTSGHVLFEEEDLFRMSERELANFRARKVGFIFQSHMLLPEFSAQENVALAAMIQGESKSEALEKSARILDRVGLGDRLNHRPGKLSGGEQQRVAIARALVNDPALALADEPTGNLDTTTGDTVFTLLAQLNQERGTTFVIVTHNLELAARMGRVVRIMDGRIVDNQAM